MRFLLRIEHKTGKSGTTLCIVTIRVGQAFVVINILYLIKIDYNRYRRLIIIYTYRAI